MQERDQMYFLYELKDEVQADSLSVSRLCNGELYFENLAVLFVSLKALGAIGARGRISFAISTSSKRGEFSQSAFLNYFKAIPTAGDRESSSICRRSYSGREQCL